MNIKFYLNVTTETKWVRSILWYNKQANRFGCMSFNYPGTTYITGDYLSENTAKANRTLLSIKKRL